MTPLCFYQDDNLSLRDGLSDAQIACEIQRRRERFQKEQHTRLALISEAERSDIMASLPKGYAQAVRALTEILMLKKQRVVLSENIRESGLPEKFGQLILHLFDHPNEFDNTREREDPFKTCIEILRALENGEHLDEEDDARRRTTPEQVAAIRVRRSKGESLTKLAATFNIARSTVVKICKG